MKSISKTVAARLKQTAAPLPESSYEWFTNQGKTFTINSPKYGRVQLTKGTKFGLRRSSSGNQMRLILEGAPTKVMSLTHEDASRLKLGSDAVKPGPKTKAKLAPGNDKSDPAVLSVLEKLVISLRNFGAKVTIKRVGNGVAEYDVDGKLVGFIEYDLTKNRLVDGVLEYKGVSLNLFEMYDEVVNLKNSLAAIKDQLEGLRTAKDILRPLAFHFQPKLVKTLDRLDFAL